MERYEIVKDIGSGSFGDAKLVRHKITRDFFAVKFIQRGSTINENVEREIINQRSLKHPNIIRFKEILLTPTHLAIVMEYASGGELFQRICDAGRAIEDEARFFFQQLISGVSYCHSMGICHRDLKLENMLLDGSVAPRVKICDFGCSKSSTFHSQPKSAVGTAAYIAPEVFSQKEYDGKIADVWSCGVSLYVMLVWDYPFGDPKDPEGFSTTMRRILSANYTIPDSIQISEECRQLLYKIFVANPKERITIPEIKQHPWYLKNLPVEWQEGGSSQSTDANDASQSIAEILSMVQEARALPEGLSTVGDIMDFLDDGDTEDIEASGEFTEDMEASGEFVCPM